MNAAVAVDAVVALTVANAVAIVTVVIAVTDMTIVSSSKFYLRIKEIILIEC